MRSKLTLHLAAVCDCTTSFACTCNGNGTYGVYPCRGEIDRTER